MIFNGTAASVVPHAIPGITVNCMMRGVIPLEEAANRTFHAHHRSCGVCKARYGEHPCQKQRDKAETAARS